MAINKLNEKQTRLLNNLIAGENVTYCLWISSTSHIQYHTSSDEAEFASGLRFTNRPSFNMTNFIKGSRGHFEDVPMTIGSVSDKLDYYSKKHQISSLSITLDNVYYPEGKGGLGSLMQDDSTEKKYLSDYIFAEYDVEQSLIGNSMHLFLADEEDSLATPNSASDNGNIEVIPIFRGFVKDVKATNSKITFNFEDTTYKMLQREFPLVGDNLDNEHYRYSSNYLGDGEEVPKAYKNKPIPMTYGRVENAPAVIKHITEFDEELSITVDNYEDYYLDDINLTFDNRKHVGFDDMYHAGTSYLCDTGYLYISGAENQYALIKQQTSELGKDNAQINVGIFPFGIEKDEIQYTIDDAEWNNGILLNANCSSIRQDMAEISFFNYPSSIGASSLGVGGDWVALPFNSFTNYNDLFSLTIGDWVDDETTDGFNYSSLYDKGDGAYFTKFECATNDVDWSNSPGYGEDDETEWYLDQPFDISGFSVKFSEAGFNMVSHLACPMFRLGIRWGGEDIGSITGNEYLKNSKLGRWSYYGSTANTTEAPYVPEAGSGDSGYNEPSFRTKWHSGIVFAPRIEILDELNGVLPSQNPPEGEGTGVGLQEIVQLNDTNPTHQWNPYWVGNDKLDQQSGESASYEGPSKRNYQSHMIFDNYSPFKWIGTSPRYAEGIYSFYRRGNGTEFWDGLFCPGGGEEMGNHTTNYLVNGGYFENTDWDWSWDIDDVRELHLAKKKMMYDTNTFEIFNFMVFHVGHIDGLANRKYHVNTLGRESVTGAGNNLVRLYINTQHSNKARIQQWDGYGSEEDAGENLGGNFSHEEQFFDFHDSFNQDFDIETEPMPYQLNPNMEAICNFNDWTSDAVSDTGESDFAFSAPLGPTEDYANNEFTADYWRLIMRYPLDSHKLIGTTIECGETGAKGKVVKIHYDKFIYTTDHHNSPLYTPYTGGTLSTDLPWQMKPNYSQNKFFWAIPDIIMIDVQQLTDTEFHQNASITIDEDTMLPTSNTDFNFFSTDASKWTYVAGANINPSVSDSSETKFCKYLTSYKWSDGMVEKPGDIIEDLLVAEMNYSEGILEEELDDCRLEHSAFNGEYDWSLAFSIEEKITAQDLFTHIANSTKMFPRFNSNDGQFTFNTLRERYYPPDHGYHEGWHDLSPEKVISFKWKMSDLKYLKNEVNVKYAKFYGGSSYLKETGFITVGDVLSRQLGSDWESAYGSKYLTYYRITEDEDDHKLEVENNYIRDEVTAIALAEHLLLKQMNQAAIITLEYPMISEAFSIEVGDVIYLPSMPNQQKIQGVDFTKVQSKFGQIIYPLFFVTSLKKDIQKNKMTIEGHQIHCFNSGTTHLSDWAEFTSLSNHPTDFSIDHGMSNVAVPTSYDGHEEIPDIEYYGCLDPEALNYGWTIDGENVGAENITYDGANCIYEEASMAAWGDSTLDGTVDILDIVQIVTHILAINPIWHQGDQSFANADVNFDDTIDVLDVIAIVSVVLGNSEIPDWQESNDDEEEEDSDDTFRFLPTWDGSANTIVSEQDLPGKIMYNHTPPEGLGIE